MPLLDHFHPPLSKQRHWDSFHGAWAEAIARYLNEDLLPPHFYAEARIKIGTRLEIDVATLEETYGHVKAVDDGGVAVWAPPAAVASAQLDFAGLDLFEVNILNDEAGPKIVAAIELVSPGNKDRPANRRAFSVKCASYLQDGISVMMVDVVTERHGNLLADLLDFLKLNVATPAQTPDDLYATAYLPLLGAKQSRVEICAFVEAKSFRQAIHLSSDRRLRDDNVTSQELRDWLAAIPLELLRGCVEECLAESFDDGPLALQDSANEIGVRARMVSRHQAARSLPHAAWRSPMRAVARCPHRYVRRFSGRP